MPLKSILDSLTLPKKCALIALPLLLAFGFLFQQMYTQINTLIGSSENELRGAIALEKINPVFQSILAGRAEKQTESIGKASETLNKLKAELPESWPNTKANIGKVVELLPVALSKQATPAQSEALGNHMVTLIRQLADESELTLDPYLPSYYMMSPMAFQLPGVMEYLADLEGKLRFQDSDVAGTLSFARSRIGTLNRALEEIREATEKSAAAGEICHPMWANTLTPLANIWSQSGRGCKLNPPRI